MEFLNEYVFSVFFVETLLNGLLYGGVLALLSLGLNLIFGVIDVVWICYAELVMLGMYTIYFMHVFYGLPLIPAALIAVLMVAVLGLVLHKVVINHVLGKAPINQLLATGGVLFFLQSIATLFFGVEFLSLGVSLGSFQLSEDIYISTSQFVAFLVAAGAVVAMYLFLSRSYMGAAIRAISQDRDIMILMGVDANRLYGLTSAIGGGLAGLAACLLSLQFDVHPFVGISFGPIVFMICVMGGLGNMVGGFLAAFVFAELIAIGGYFADLEWGTVLAFCVFVITMFIRPEGLFARKS
ncbi:MAG: branched-chain amino acid ABC transporter permease [Alphaproteobacteria bacterium]